MQYRTIFTDYRPEYRTAQSGATTSLASNPRLPRRQSNERLTIKIGACLILFVIRHIAGGLAAYAALFWRPRGATPAAFIAMQVEPCSLRAWPFDLVNKQEFRMLLGIQHPNDNDVACAVV